MNIDRAPECLTLTSPQMESRGGYAYPPVKRGSRVLESLCAPWMFTEGEESDVLEHGANTWHATPEIGVHSVLEHSHDELNLLEMNEIDFDHRMPPLEVPVWHATSAVADEDPLEHSFNRWHAIVNGGV